MTDSRKSTVQSGFPAVFLQDMPEWRDRDVKGDLRELEHIYRTAPVGLCLMDTQLRYLRINQWLAEINGISIEDHVGRTLREIVPEIADSMEPVYAKVIETGEPAIDVLATGATAAHPEKKRHFLANYYPLKDEEGIVWGLSSIVRDVTEQKQYEDKLRKAHDELETRVVERTCELEALNAQLTKEIDDRVKAEAALHKSLVEINDLRDRLQVEAGYLRDEIKTSYDHEGMVGDSHALRKTLKHVDQVAGTDSTVLILGETGTGKELIARAIHDQSSRKARALVKVNCAGLPPTLVEAELFGREKGAYTGAMTRQTGRFEVADGSTIFLDEIGELSLEMQAKLLRVLQDGEFERLGSPKTIKVDVRIIAATNRDLSEEVRQGRFRQDLYFRLYIFPITVPPLRDRREDVPALTWHFVRELGGVMGKVIEKISKRSMKALQAYSWPGNIRELRNLVERSLIISTGSTLRITVPARSDSIRPSVGASLEDVEREHIEATLESCGWRIRGAGGAAEVLDLKPTTLEARMKKLGVSRPRPDL